MRRGRRGDDGRGRDGHGDLGVDRSPVAGGYGGQRGAQPAEQGAGYCRINVRNADAQGRWRCAGYCRIYVRRIDVRRYWRWAGYCRIYARRDDARRRWRMRWRVFHRMAHRQGIAGWKRMRAGRRRMRGDVSDKARGLPAEAAWWADQASGGWGVAYQSGWALLRLSLVSRICPAPSPSIYRISELP